MGSPSIFGVSTDPAPPLSEWGSPKRFRVSVFFGLYGPFLKVLERGFGSLAPHYSPLPFSSSTNPT